MTSSPHEKHQLRKDMKARREMQAPSFTDAGTFARDLFLKSFPQAFNVALYYPMKSELDTHPLYESLLKKGAVISLPLVTDEHLIFKKWSPETQLTPGSYATREPSPSSETIIPEIVIVPLLAFDRKGYRLGYGKGHFDRALKALRAQNSIIAVGYAYAFQEVDSVPHEPHDEQLDYVITEQEIISCV